jgi:hypothetical protein
VDGLTLYRDSDGDGFGDPASATYGCPGGAGLVERGDDCEDGIATVFPGSHSIEDGTDDIDTDCDGNLACDDLNCDGWPDLVLWSAGSYPSASDRSVYYLSDEGSFDGVAAYPIPGEGVYSAHAADLDADGYPDLIVGHQYGSGGGGIDIYPGTISGPDLTASAVQSLEGDNTLAICLEDFDGDGDTDIAQVNHGGLDTKGAVARIWWNNAGLFNIDQAADLIGGNGVSCATGDLDRDGLPDLTVANYGVGTELNDTSYLYRSDGGAFDLGSVPLSAKAPLEVLTGDLTGDGRDDAFFVSRGDPSDAYWTTSTAYTDLGDGFDSVDVAAQIDTQGAEDGVLADFNQDGLLDVALSWFTPAAAPDPLRGGVQVYLNDGGSFSLAFEAEHLLGVEVSAEDLNGDDYPELILSQLSDGERFDVDSYVYWSSAGEFSVEDRTALPTHGSAHHSVTDLDGDGEPELVFGGAYTGSTDSPSQSANTVIYSVVDGDIDPSDFTLVAGYATYSDPLVVGSLP